MALSHWDCVCRNASIFHYSIIIIIADGIVTVAISGSRWAAEAERHRNEMEDGDIGIQN